MLGVGSLHPAGDLKSLEPSCRGTSKYLGNSSGPAGNEPGMQLRKRGIGSYVCVHPLQLYGQPLFERYSKGWMNQDLTAKRRQAPSLAARVPLTLGTDFRNLTDTI